MKLFDQNLELSVIKKICTLDVRDASAILGTIDQSFFYTDMAITAYARIKNLARERTEIPSWDELVTDPTISEEYREIFKNFTDDTERVGSKALPNIIKGQISNLLSFKKARAIHRLSEKIQEEIVKDSIDIDALYQEVAVKLTEGKTGEDLTNCFTKIGSDSNCLQKLKDIMSGKSIRYIPTGFRGWDNINQGFPAGKLCILAATSGGGKSLCANQLALNMALNNVRTCIVPLEMSAEDMLHRFLANKTDLSMTDITNASQLNIEVKRDALRKFREFEKRIAESGTSIDLFHPPEDVDMETLLQMLRPYEYNVVIIDYIGLLAGFDGDNQWRKMGDAVRYAKRWAESTGTTVIILAQLSDDMIIRYSRAMKEHADLMWTWNSGKLSEMKEGEAILKIEPQKGRNQAQIPFYVKVNYKKMQMVDATQQEIDMFESKKKSHNKAPVNETIQKGQIDNDLYADL